MLFRRMEANKTESLKEAESRDERADPPLLAGSNQAEKKGRSHHHSPPPCALTSYVNQRRPLTKGFFEDFDRAHSRRVTGPQFRSLVGLHYGAGATLSAVCRASCRGNTLPFSSALRLPPRVARVVCMHGPYPK